MNGRNEPQFHSKNIKKMALNHMKRCLIFIIRESKFKLHWDTTCHLSDWQKIKNMTSIFSGKTMVNQAFLQVASRNTNWHNPSWNFAVSNYTTYWSRSPTSRNGKYTSNNMKTDLHEVIHCNRMLEIFESGWINNTLVCSVQK